MDSGLGTNDAPRAARARRGGRPLGGWVGRMAWSLRFAAARPDLWPSALAAFLVRGGIVFFVLPIVVLPSVIGVAQGFGLDAFDIARQPTPWFIAVVAIAIVLVVAWLVAVAWLGGATDAWLVAAAREGEGSLVEAPAADARPARVGRATLLRMAAIRAACLVPLGAAIGYAAVRIYDAAYFELLTPVDLATPIVVRVVLDAWDAVAIVVAVWLLEEAVAALAVRRLLTLDRGAIAALGGAVGQCLRRPVVTLATAAVTFAGSAVAIGIPLAVSSAAFDWCRIAARTLMPVTLGIGPWATTRDFRPIAVALAAAVLVAAWLAGLLAAAVSAVWRSAAYTGEVEADTRRRAAAETGTFDSAE